MEGIPEAEIRDHEAQKQCKSKVILECAIRLTKFSQNYFSW